MGKAREECLFLWDFYSFMARFFALGIRLTFWIPTSIVKGFVPEGLGQSKGRKAPSSRHDPGPALFPRPLL